MTQRWPDFVIAGVAKGGTTSLHAYLSQHPDLFLSTPKEPQFFARVWDQAVKEGNLEAERSKYLALFADAGDRLAGEASTTYFWHPKAPTRLHAANPDARIILSLRDPVRRAYSHYLTAQRIGAEPLSFPEAIARDIAVAGQPGERWERYVDSGRYAHHVNHWINTFGRHQVHVLLLEDLQREPEAVLAAVARFLDVDPSGLQGAGSEVHNPHREPRNSLVKRLWSLRAVRHLSRAIPAPVRSFARDRFLFRVPAKPPLDEATAALLREHFRPEAEALEALLGPEAGLRSKWSATFVD